MADGLIMEATGLEDLDRIFREADQFTRFLIGLELARDMEYVLTAAKEITPREEGDLEGSGEVVGPEFDSDGVSVAIQFGVNPPLSYALEQHENLFYKHSEGRSAKYVEIPLMEWVSEGGPEDVGRRVAEALGARYP